MDQALKARLIGAVILVIVAVLVIPELLSGRKADQPIGKAAAGSGDSRTITIELGAPEPQATPSPTPSQPQQWSIPEASSKPPVEVAANPPVANEPPVPGASSTERSMATAAPTASRPGKAAGSPPADTTAAA